MITVQVFGEDELLEHLADRRLVGTHLISITDPGLTTLPEFGASFDSVLRLQFLDLESEEEAQEDSRFLVTEAQIREIVEYYNEHKGAERWTVHCWQGISRSTAVALGLMVLGGKTEADAWETLRAIRPQASPNRLVLELWDRVTGSALAAYR